MNDQFVINAKQCYQVAEMRAAEYFSILEGELIRKNYVNVLTDVVDKWKRQHIRQPSLLSFFTRKTEKAAQSDYQNYIRYLDLTGKLENYLDRSISYIFLRDLGKTLDTPDTKKRIQRSVTNLKKFLSQSSPNNPNNQEKFSIAKVYRSAQKNGIESSMIWLFDKLKTVAANIPEGLDADHAQRKLIKIIAGVYMHAFEELDDDIAPTARARKLDEALRLGYSYGLTYPFIDDLLDSKVLSAVEKMAYSEIIRTTLTTGTVPELGQWNGKNEELIRYIHSELREAFEYIKAHVEPDKRENFFEQAYVFFQSQEEDRDKDLANPTYSNEEIFIPIILKSASSRLIVRSVVSAPEDEGFDNRTFLYGIYNQLADDFTDMFDDYQAGAVTPYTYYLEHHNSRDDLINPFELYWTVIAYLIRNVYHSDPKTCEVIMDRAINGLKRYKERMGTEKYDEVMELFFSEEPRFAAMIQKLVDKADDVDFFDKLLRDHIITNLKNDRREQEEFLDTIERVRAQVNDVLRIPKPAHDSGLKEPIIEAANYSLEGDGKRLRPIITWVMGVTGYGLDGKALFPLLRALEYMHTASLIFDDLPSQDNSPKRRGRITLHQKYNNAVAELTGLFLTQKAIEEQTALSQFDAKNVLELIQYSTRVVGEMCRGQAMDLGSKGKPMTLAELDTLCFYKTGLAFEASLVMPAILANAGETEIAALKKFARHAGIAFQIKDDLLDVEGDLALLGKPVGKDEDNNSATFVSVLGIEDARKQMWDHYCQAIETLEDIPRNTVFLKHLMNYIVSREK